MVSSWTIARHGRAVGVDTTLLEATVRLADGDGRIDHDALSIYLCENDTLLAFGSHGAFLVDVTPLKRSTIDREPPESAHVEIGRFAIPEADPSFQRGLADSVYAGKYQPEAMGVLRDIETPAYVAVVGKPRSYETDEGDTLVSLTPESITTIEQGTRDAWVVETAEQTLERIAAMDDVEMGEEASEDIESALEAYGEDVDFGAYEQGAKEALAQVAGIGGVEEADEEDEE